GTGDQPLPGPGGAQDLGALGGGSGSGGGPGAVGGPAGRSTGPGHRGRGSRSPPGGPEALRPPAPHPDGGTGGVAERLRLGSAGAVRGGPPAGASRGAFALTLAESVP